MDETALIRVTRSLNTKLLLIVIGVVTFGGLLAAFRQEWVETQRLQAIYDHRLQRLAASYQQRVAEELQQRQLLLHAAQEVLQQHLFTAAQPVPTDFTLTQDQDQAWRLFDGISAVFVHQDTRLTPATLGHIYRSRDVWEQLVPLLRTSFSAVYFITEDRMTRIWPTEIVRAHHPDHDVTQEIFYTLAIPSNNPAGEPRWTPIYFDLYTQAWMISLVYPIYKPGAESADGEKEFVGVMGADLDVTFLLTTLANLNVDNDAIKSFIFDHQGELILHSEQQQLHSHNVQKNYELLNEMTKIDGGLADYIRAVVKRESAPGVIELKTIEGEEQHIGFYPLDNMNWYLSLYYPQAMVNKQLDETLADIYLNIVILTVFLSLVLYWSLSYFVTRRVSALAAATASVSQLNWKVTVPQQGRDEISFLGRSINIMLRKINDLIEGLNANITQLEKVNQESKKLIAAIESSTSIVVILNPHWVLEYANAQFWKQSGYEEADNLVGERALLFVQGEENQFQLDAIAAELRKTYYESGAQHSSWHTEYLAQRKDGSRFWLMQTLSAIFSDDGDLDCYIAVAHDATDMKKNQQKVEQLAYYDHLTGLHNRVLFKDQLRTALNIVQRDKSHFALMYLDLDHFKRINDTLGHEAGDSLLIEVARRIKDCLREEDVVARLGGDEFAVLLHQVGSAQYAYVVANKIIAALNTPWLLAGQEVVIGVSIGITLAPDDSLQLDALMKNADLAMYRAKEKGRNTFQFYTADMNQQVEHRLALESDLRHALRNQEFELYYQPILDLRTNKIVSVEALLRWHHPLRGMVSPLDFISVAEDSGLIVPIGKWVVRNACLQAKNIQKALHRPLKIAVNVSAKQLHDNGFIVAIEAALEDIKLSPEWLSIELTETTLMKDGDKAIERLKRIRAMGIGIAIDDFGTGYSSLSHLKRLPVNTLKIDRSFVEGLPGDEEDRAITTLIVAMATSLNYKVVVEGVETAAQLAFLTLCGCDYAQGYFFSKPVPADQLMQLLFDQATTDDSEHL